jgi:hypothetical protein
MSTSTPLSPQSQPQPPPPSASITTATASAGADGWARWAALGQRRAHSHALRAAVGPLAWSRLRADPGDDVLR